jgi:hypothetical protein
VNELGLTLLKTATTSLHTRTTLHNPQTLFSEFKTKIMKLARLRAKETIPKLDAQIRKCKDELHAVLNNPVDPQLEKMFSASILEEKLSALETTRHKRAQHHGAARNRLEGETISKYWVSLNKSRTPRDTIHALHIPDTNPPHYEHKSSAMAQLAMNYHNELQSKDLSITRDNPMLVATHDTALQHLHQ